VSICSDIERKGLVGNIPVPERPAGEESGSPSAPAHNIPDNTVSVNYSILLKSFICDEKINIDIYLFPAET
jgi:hypothetical protein